MQKKKVSEQILTYAKYVDTHPKEIAKLINAEFEKQKEDIKEKIFDWIEECFESGGTCQHYNFLGRIMYVRKALSTKTNFM